MSVSALADQDTLTGLRLLLSELKVRESLLEYCQRGGYSRTVWSLSPDEIRGAVHTSGLSGRGGSHFPTGRKLDAVAGQSSPKVVLVNGAETEPGSQKDRWLLTLRPHLVLEGAQLAARAAGAAAVVLYLPEQDRRVQESVSSALAELRQERRSTVSWRIVAAPRRYVAGEESAAIQRANGKSAKPTLKPPYPADRGVGGRPTLVHNAETLANFPRILTAGPEAFQALGTPGHPGTMLVTVSGQVRKPGPLEVPAGAQLTDVLALAGAPQPTAIQAVLPGGIFAGWLAGAVLQQGVRLERDSLRAFGVSAGAGAITVVSDEVCGLCQAVAVLQYFTKESVQQCGPCTYGTQAMATLLLRVARGEGGAEDLSRIEHYATAMLPRRGACGHLDGAAAAARTALRVFDRDITRHMRRGSCGRPWRVVVPELEEIDVH
ncbi:MAG: SLBB domain-containing protein [Chloroflexi bacterium]|nr:SLBB domain-containing protein [Chloroflexota bacterium]